MKDIIINGNLYNGISTIEVQTADGGTARFIDEDEGGSMRSETMTFSTTSELYNKVNEIYAQNPLMTIKVSCSQELTGAEKHHYLNNSDSPEVITESFNLAGADMYFRVGSYVQNQMISFLSCADTGYLNLLLRQGESVISRGDIQIDETYSELRQSYGIITDDNISTITFTFYY